jgi:quaternary ammonium compound-resistance protein SugE
MAWLILFVAGLCEVGWAITLKYTHGFTRVGPTVGVFAGGVLSVYLLGMATKTIPIGTGYAVWTGIGAVGTALLGIALFNEPKTALRLGCIALIVAGIVGLRLVSPR